MDQEISWSLLREVNAPRERKSTALIWEGRASVVKDTGANPSVDRSPHKQQAYPSKPSKLDDLPLIFEMSGSENRACSGLFK